MIEEIGLEVLIFDLLRYILNLDFRGGDIRGIRKLSAEKYRVLCKFFI